jgi:hypothetical protein
MTKKSRRAPAQVDRAKPQPAKHVKSGRPTKTSARAMREVAQLIREVVALEKRAGGGSSVFSLKPLKAGPRPAGGTKGRRRKRAKRTSPAK